LVVRWQPVAVQKGCPRGVPEKVELEEATTEVPMVEPVAADCRGQQQSQHMQ
jgi:hypothetical protein